MFSYQKCMLNSLKFFAISPVRYASKISKYNVGIVGCPFSKGQRKSGTDLAPDAIRNGGLINEIQSFNEWVSIKDYGDITVGKPSLSTDYPKNMRNYGEVVSTMKNLSEKCLEILNDQRLCIALGGDHTLGFGSIAGHLKYNEDIAVFWIDAHADLNTDLTSGSGNMHGMSVALLAKELENYWPKLYGMEWMKPKISLKNFVFIGLRAVDPLEKLIATKFNMHMYGMNDIDKLGISKIMEMALDNVDPGNKKGIHVSFDIDALDELEAPSTGTSVRGGLSLREGIYIVEELCNTGRLEAMDLVEVNPSIGSLEDCKKTIDASINLIKASCGTIRSGNSPKKLKNIEPHLSK